MEQRCSGILLHITSLPSPYGIGDLGPSAYKFADFLVKTKQKYWQLLPLTRTSVTAGNSPYSSISAFAGNPLLISPELMVQDGFLVEEDLACTTEFDNERVDYSQVTEFKNRIFDISFDRFKTNGDKGGYENFCVENSYWLNDVALFVAIKDHLGMSDWALWPDELRNREPEALKEITGKLNDGVEKEKFLQYLFYLQWSKLKTYCNEQGISIFGDMPIYVIYKSADVWSHPGLFKLDDNNLPVSVAGVPPDYFSDTGQLWGNPVYKWDAIKETGYDWWIKRTEHNLKLFDYTRVDHFRGFAAYWEIEFDEDTAINGKWVKAPGKDLFNTLIKRFPSLPIVAEDLGVITEDVKELINYFGFPGMKILMFAYGDDLATNPYIPHNHIENCVVYTGTHDNNTARGWFENEIDEDTKNRLFQYVGHRVEAEDVNRVLIRQAMMSVAKTVIFPMQDVLGLGQSARMNMPSTPEGNWEWRLLPELVTPQIVDRLRAMTKIYGRFIRV